MCVCVCVRERERERERVCERERALDVSRAMDEGAHAGPPGGVLGIVPVVCGEEGSYLRLIDLCITQL